MEKRDAGWCAHLRVAGFFRPGGSTAFKIESVEPFYLWWVNEQCCVMMCEECYRAANPLTGVIPALLPTRGPTEPSLN